MRTVQVTGYCYIFSDWLKIKHYVIRLVSSAVIIRDFLLSSKHSAIASRMFRSLPNILRRVGRCDSNVFFRRVGRFRMVRSSESNAPRSPSQIAFK